MTRGTSPWFHGFCLEAMQQELEVTTSAAANQNSADTASRPQQTPKLVQMVAWEVSINNPTSPTFWETKNPHDPAWATVTDGQYECLVYWTQACRQAIFQETCCPPPPLASQALNAYRKGSVGLLEDYEWYSTKRPSPSSSSNKFSSSEEQVIWRRVHEKTDNSTDNKESIVLVVHSWKAQDNLFQVVLPTSTILPRLSHQWAIRQALQSKIVLGSLEEAVQNPLWMDELFDLAQFTANEQQAPAPAPPPPPAQPQQLQDEAGIITSGTSSTTAAATSSVNPSTPPPAKHAARNNNSDSEAESDDDDDDDDDDDMNELSLTNMLATQPTPNKGSSTPKRTQAATTVPMSPGQVSVAATHGTAASQQEDYGTVPEEEEPLPLTQPPLPPTESTQVPPLSQTLETQPPASSATTPAEQTPASTALAIRRGRPYYYSATTSYQDDEDATVLTNLSSAYKSPASASSMAAARSTAASTTRTTPATMPAANLDARFSRATQTKRTRTYWDQLKEQLDDPSLTHITFSVDPRPRKLLRKGGLSRWLRKNLKA